MRRGALLVGLIGALAMWCGGCPFSTFVSEPDMLGEHIAEYEFGTDRLALLPGGEFQQTITVGNETLSRRGRWRRDEGRLVLVGWTEVADPFGRLNAGWQQFVISSEVSMSVERIWFQVVLGSGATVPYRKVD